MQQSVYGHLAYFIFIFLLTDYCGKYNPMDDLGGFVIFDEIMESYKNYEKLSYVLEEYDLSRDDLSKIIVTLAMYL